MLGRLHPSGELLGTSLSPSTCLVYCIPLVSLTMVAQHKYEVVVVQIAMLLLLIEAQSVAALAVPPTGYLRWVFG